MPTLPTQKNAIEFPLSIFGGWSIASLAASQAAVALKLHANDAASGSLLVTDIPAPFAGSIVGIGIVLNTNVTAGVLTLTPTINATAIATPAGLVNVAVAISARKKVATVDAQLAGARFAAADLLGIKVTTNGAFTPTPDLYAYLLVVYEAVQL